MEPHVANAVVDSLLERPSKGNGVPRIPSSQAIAKALHASIISWSTPEILCDEHLVHWCIVISSESEDISVHTNSSSDQVILPLMLEDLHQLLENQQADVWIAVPKRNRFVAKYFSQAGYEVTASLNPINRAARQIDAIVAQVKTAQVRRAKEHGLLRSAPLSTQKAHHSRCEQGKTEQSAQLWQPELWAVAQEHPDALVIGVDASADLSGACAISMISSHGDLVLYSGESFEPTAVLEFRALIAALEFLTRSTTREAVVHTDSADAFRIAQDLIRSNTYSDGLCGISEELCLEFAHVWSNCPIPVELDLHRGHSGLLLNEAADELAWLARAASKCPQEQAEPELLARITNIQAKVVCEFQNIARSGGSEFSP